MTDSSEVTWWLKVSTGDQWHSTLLSRKVGMAHLPAEGDTVQYLASEEEPDGSVAGYVKHRYWNLDGSAHLVFQDVIIDPGDTMPPAPHRTQTYWWTNQDGDIWQYIERSGWQRYA